jgi:diadenosine tetraphosphate (Ap4A) HIT family hydrolase
MDQPRCSACELLAGKRSVPGGLLLREGGFALHALDGPSPLAGWLVLTALGHCRAVADLDDQAAQALGPMVRRVMRAQRAALGAEHVYLFAIGDLLHHAHLHLVPRYAATPERLRGRGCFEARPEEARPVEELAMAARLVAEALGQGAAPG